MKISMKRIGALVLALVMVFGLLPVINNTAEALDVSGTWNDSTIGLSYEKGVNPNTAITPWTASGNTLTGACAGKTLGANYLASSNTLTITNLKSSTAKLSFDFELTGVFGSVTIDGTTYTEATSGSFSKELEENESIQIQLSAKKQLKSAGINTIGISITNLLLTVVGSGPVTTTFEAPAFGSYSVAYGDTTLDVAAGTASQSATNLPDVTYTLTANPGTGYKFVGWLDVTANKYLGIDATYVGGFESTSTVKAIIVPESDPVFKTGDQYYSDLNEAVAYAQENALNQITLVQDGTLSAGSYTIPAGITLLIPKDTEYTVTGTDEMGIAPEYTTDVETPYAYRVLTMAEGAELIVNGVLDIEAKHTTYQGSPASRPYGGRVCGPYGAIYMSPNSSITVNNDAKLYAWGYVYGDGNVTANSGAEVYEIMQVTDFPGGGNMAGFVDNDPTYDFDGDGNPTNDYIKTFPFSQYYVQNIEVALTLHAGAAEYVYVSMTASSVSMGLPVQFIGESGMFNPADGTIVKDYDPSTDRLNVYVNGDATMAGITIDLTGTKFENTVKDVIGSSKVDSTTFILTLNSNISININSGITTVEQDLHLLPGVEISIAKDATLVIAQHNFAANTYDNISVYGSGGYNVYVWDLENWGNYAFQNKKLVALNYSPTAGRIVRSTSDLKDVVIDVNGKVICEGYIYSTVTVDDEYTPVSGGGAIISSGKTGVIVMQNGCGVEDDAFCLNGSSNEDSSTAVDPAWLQNGDGSYLKTWCGECYFDVCPTCWGDRATMLDCEDCGGTGMADKICSHVGQIFSYCENHDCWYAEGHKDSTVEVTWIINGNGGPEEYTICSIPSYKGSTPTKPANGCTSYTFTGWAATANGEVLTQLPIVEADVTYFAIFTESVVHMGDNNQDHKCDGCGNPESTCVDADNDHHCDYEGCKELISDCEDTNNDHYCDHEGCKAQMSACEDANADHYCDYSGCQAEVSVCKDSNFDHLCDYAGCQATLSSCEDVNADHYCDYEGCQAQTSDCDDADADHYCDYVGCGEELSTCIDGDDKDHNCDYVGCQAENVDGGHHGGTAYCNTPKICAECGQEYGTTDANNHAYSDSTYYGDITASSHTVYYSCCGGVKVTEPHTYVSGICGCNAKQTFTIKWNNNGTIMETDVVEYGEIPVYNGATPTKTAVGYTYTFTSWSPAVVAATKDMTYNAVYSASVNSHFVILKDENGTELGRVEYEYNVIISQNTLDAYAQKKCYTLDDWYYENGQSFSSTRMGDEDIVLIAKWNGPNHSWVDADCDNDGYCSVCGEAGDPALGHSYNYDCDTNCSVCGKLTRPEAECVSDAEHDCQDGSCIYCGEDVAATEAHDWLDATCTEAATCGNCGATTGSALGHGHTEGLYYEEEGENTHSIFCDDCYTTIQWNVKCTDTIGDGDHKCDFCPNENITDHRFDPATHECECGALETFTVTWLFNGGVMDEQWKQQLISEGYTVTDTSVSGTFPYGDFAPHAPGVTKDGYILIGYTDQYGKFNEGQEIFTLTEDMTYTMVWECAHSDKTYTDLGNGFHKVTCDTCSETLVESEGHDYTYDTRNHKCQCGAVEEFKLTVVYGVNGEYSFEIMVPYWTRMDSLDEINNIPWDIYANDATHFGRFFVDDYYWDMDGDGDLDRDRYFTEGYMTDEDMYVEVRYEFNGFVHDGNGWKYRKYGSFYKDEMITLTEYDVYENGSDEVIVGIYMVGADGYRIENGLGRWYYLGQWNGVTYEPNAEDIAYYEGKGQTFIDKEKTWYYFGADGKLAFDYTGLVGDSYVINGQAAWHIGLVEIDGEYYYFKGDEVNGGNKMVSGGDFYLNRNNSDFNMVVGGIYTFDNDGKMQWKFHGIEESDLFEGKRHYIGGRLTPGLGLVDLITVATGEVRYFYVDSYGQLILDAEYYIGANSFGLAKGIYYFDAEGFLVIPEEEPGKSGLFFEEGKWYYYVDGAKAYCAGLIEIDGNWVYVKSDGSLATGVYYVTNTNDHATIASGTKCTFDDNGVLIDPVINMQVLDEGSASSGEGFNWEEDHAALIFTPSTSDKLIIEVSNIVLDDEHENVGFVVDVYAENYGWLGENFVQDGDIEYYVSSNMGQCIVYIFTAYEDGDYCEPASGTYDYKISIGNDGSPKNGIIDGYYYVDGHIAYAAGLIEIDGIYYYVRSNGQIATGKYWITNHNDLLPEGFYDFGEDGFYYPPVPENSYLVKDVVKNTETDGFYGYLGTAEGILPQADGMLYIEVTDITYAEEILNAAGFDIFVDSSDYWAAQFGPSVVGTATIMMPVTAGNHYVIFVNPADIDGEDYSVINGTITYKIWSTVECDLEEVSIGE